MKRERFFLRLIIFFGFISSCSDNLLSNRMIGGEVNSKNKNQEEETTQEVRRCSTEIREFLVEKLNHSSFTEKFAYELLRKEKDNLLSIIEDGNSLYKGDEKSMILLENLKGKIKSTSEREDLESIKLCIALTIRLKLFENLTVDFCQFFDRPDENKIGVEIPEYISDSKLDDEMYFDETENPDKKYIKIISYGDFSKYADRIISCKDKVETLIEEGIYDSFDEEDYAKTLSAYSRFSEFICKNNEDCLKLFVASANIMKTMHSNLLNKINEIKNLEDINKEEIEELLDFFQKTIDSTNLKEIIDKQDAMKVGLGKVFNDLIVSHYCALITSRYLDYILSMNCDGLKRILNFYNDTIELLKRNLKKNEPRIIAFQVDVVNFSSAEEEEEELKKALEFTIREVVENFLTESEKKALLNTSLNVWMNNYFDLEYLSEDHPLSLLNEVDKKFIEKKGVFYLLNENIYNGVKLIDNVTKLNPTKLKYFIPKIWKSSLNNIACLLKTKSNRLRNKIESMQEETELHDKNDITRLQDLLSRYGSGFDRSYNKSYTNVSDVNICSLIGYSEDEECVVLDNFLVKLSIPGVEKNLGSMEVAVMEYALEEGKYRPFFHVGVLVCRPCFQGLGLGSTLIESLKLFGMNIQLKTVKMEKLISFYRKCGFEEQKVSESNLQELYPILFLLWRCEEDKLEGRKGCMI